MTHSVGMKIRVLNHQEDVAQISKKKKPSWKLVKSSLYSSCSTTHQKTSNKTKTKYKSSVTILGI